MRASDGDRTCYGSIAGKFEWKEVMRFWKERVSAVVREVRRTARTIWQLSKFELNDTFKEHTSAKHKEEVGF